MKFLEKGFKDIICGSSRVLDARGLEIYGRIGS